MKRLVRENQAFPRMGVGRSKFRRDFVAHDPSQPYVPGTSIKRLKPVPIGVRNHAFLEEELDALIEALVALRDKPCEPVRHNLKRKEPAPVVPPQTRRPRKPAPAPVEVEA